MKKAVILLSGGIDSSTALFIAKEKGYECYPLVFDYNQRHRKEVECANKVSETAGCKPTLMRIRFPWRGSALIDKAEVLPVNRSLNDMKKEIPSTYVPSRNAIFLSFALSYAETIGAYKIFIGANSVDFSGYPDCKPTFLRAFEGMARSGTKMSQGGKQISIESPLLLKKKSQIIREGIRLNVPYRHTWSCYEGKTNPCGACDACVIRKKGFEEAGAIDPLE